MGTGEIKLIALLYRTNSRGQGEVIVKELATNQDWVSRLADGLATTSRDTGEPQTATWTGKDWACHRADIQGICLS